MIIGKKQIDNLRVPLYVQHELEKSNALAFDTISNTQLAQASNHKNEESDATLHSDYTSEASSTPCTKHNTTTNTGYVSIAIDGPAGTGKSTIAKKIAQRYGYLYFSTGTLYRSFAYACLNKNIDINDEQSAVSALEQLNLVYVSADTPTGKSLTVYLDGVDITHKIHTEIISILTPVIAKYPQIREHYRNIQRSIASKNNIVMEGRDIGSVVLPNATHKFFLTASAEVRAMRRFNQLDSTDTADYQQILAEIVERDKTDSERAISPLRCPSDAILIDNSLLNIEESVQAFCDEIDKESCLEPHNIYPIIMQK